MKPIGTNILLSLDSPIQEKITFKSGHEIFLPSSINKEEWATIQGTVISGGNFNGGETVAVSYHLVADYLLVNDIPHYNRVLQYNDQVVWRADDWMIMGVLENNSWKAVGDWAIMEQINEPELQSQTIIIPDTCNKIKKGCGRHISGADAPIGTTLLFDEKFRSLYTFPDGKTFIILKKDRILAYTLNGDLI